MWIILGDFNAIFCAQEKNGCLAPSNVSCREFKETNEVSDLVRLDSSGSFFTWVHCGLCIFVERKLDPAFCSQFSSDFWKFVSCLFLARHQSDHNMILMKFVNVLVSVWAIQISIHVDRSFGFQGYGERGS